LRPRLLVVAPDMAEAVRSAGGWLFDRVMAGWDVSVLSSNDEDVRPLRILGARPLDPERANRVQPGRRWPQALAVDAGLYASNEKVREMVLEALRSGTTEVRLCGDVGQPRTTRGADPDQYRPSLAAQAFKAQAMAAADLPFDPSATEVFRSGQPGHQPPRSPEPVPAA
jgi:hypothetical protein